MTLMIRPLSLAFGLLFLSLPACIVASDDDDDDDDDKGEIGDECDDDDECESDFCDDGFCAEESVPGSQDLGEPCSASLLCRSPLVCTNGTCANSTSMYGPGTQEVGDPCAEDMHCVPNSVCFNEFCVGRGTLRVSLAFSVDSDFDLHLQTPSGEEIYYGNETADGGTLDVDQCVNDCGTSSHVENIVFNGTAPSGTYEVWVENYDGRNGGPFTIEVAGDVSQTFSGSLPADEVESMRFTFTK